MVLRSHSRNLLASLLDLDIIKAGLLQEITVPSVGLSSAIVPLLPPVKNSFWPVEESQGNAVARIRHSTLLDNVTLNSSLLGQMKMTTKANRHRSAINLQAAGILSKLQMNVFWIWLATFVRLWNRSPVLWPSLCSNSLSFTRRESRMKLLS